MAKKETAKNLLSGLFNPSSWTNPAPASKLRVELEKYFSIPAYPVNSGRSALYLILKALNVGAGDEVVVQAYTCNAVPNPIIWAGAKPVYADIDPNTLNVDTNDLKKKITSRTRAIVLQHTFGRPGPIDEVLELTKQKNLFLIEDCAHSLGAEYEGRKLGTFGDAAILSFGREKVVSSLAGGAVLVKNEKLIKPLENLVKDLKYAPYTEYLKETGNFFTWRLLIRKIFFSGFGESLLKSLNKLDTFNVVYSKKELQGEKPAKFPGLFPSPLAKIALEELSAMDEVNEQRNKIARYYEKYLKNKDFRLLKPHTGIYLRFIVLYKVPNVVFAQARKRKYWFGEWYSSPIYPPSTDLASMYYERGSCPNAESAAKQTINLPIYKGMNLEEAGEIAAFINTFK